VAGTLRGSLHELIGSVLVVPGVRDLAENGHRLGVEGIVGKSAVRPSLDVGLGGRLFG
jgi:hypothetical protein